MSATPTSSAASGRRVSLRTELPVVLVLGIVLPFLFGRVAILVLESATFCSSLECAGWRFVNGADTSLVEKRRMVNRNICVSNSSSRRKAKNRGVVLLLYNWAFHLQITRIGSSIQTDLSKRQTVSSTAVFRFLNREGAFTMRAKWKKKRIRRLKRKRRKMRQPSKLLMFLYTGDIKRLELFSKGVSFMYLGEGMMLVFSGTSSNIQRSQHAEDLPADEVNLVVPPSMVPDETMWDLSRRVLVGKLLTDKKMTWFDVEGKLLWVTYSTLFGDTIYVVDKEGKLRPPSP